jgi:uncharacterized protein (TIGR02594 family)
MNALLNTALQEIGVQEIVGNRHNAIVLEYAAESGHAWVKDDETAWCSSFMNAMARRNCLESTGKLTARSWLDVGDVIADPRIGDVVVFSRGNPKGWQGHVGIFIRQTKNEIYVLGGNQSNRVGIDAYAKNRLLGYRRLREVEQN